MSISVINVIFSGKNLIDMMVCIQIKLMSYKLFYAVIVQLTNKCKKAMKECIFCLSLKIEGGGDKWPPGETL